MDNELYHYGVLGMKWGVRRSKKSKPSIDPSYKKAHSKKKLKYMSDNELREVNNRLNLEKNYRDLTRTKSRGKAALDAFVSTAGTVAAVMGAYGTYKKLGEKIIKQIGSSKI